MCDLLKQTAVHTLNFFALTALPSESCWTMISRLILVSHQFSNITDDLVLSTTKFASSLEGFFGGMISPFGIPLPPAAAT